MKNYKSVYKIIFILLLFLGIVPFASAATICDDLGNCTSSPCNPKTEVCLSNPLGDTVSTPQALIKKVIEGVLGVVGSLALIMFIYGGFTWMMASGNQEAIKNGRDILVWAAIGLIVIFSAYAITNFIFKGIGALPAG